MSVLSVLALGLLILVLVCVAVSIFVNMTGRSVIIGDQTTELEVAKDRTVSTYQRRTNPPLVIGSASPMNGSGCGSLNCTGNVQPLGFVDVRLWHCHSAGKTP